MSALTDTALKAELASLTSMLNKVLDGKLEEQQDVDLDKDRQAADAEIAKTAAEISTDVTFEPAGTMATLAEDQRCRRDFAIATATRRELLLSVLNAGYGRYIYLKDILDNRT